MVDSPKREAPSPLLALVGIMAVWTTIELGSQTLKLLGQNDPMKGLMEGDCVYQVTINGTTVGTRSFNSAVNIKKLFQSLDLSEEGIERNDQVLECDSIVNIDRLNGQTSLDRISGNHLIAMGKRISLNKASRADLESVPGIGPKLAERIVENRSTSGQFGSIDELKRVHGVGPKKIEEFAHHLKM